MKIFTFWTHSYRDPLSYLLINHIIHRVHHWLSNDIIRILKPLEITPPPLVSILNLLGKLNIHYFAKPSTTLSHHRSLSVLYVQDTVLLYLRWVIEVTNKFYSETLSGLGLHPKTREEAIIFKLRWPIWTSLSIVLSCKRTRHSEIGYLLHTLF